MEKKIMKNPITGRKIEDIRNNIYGYLTVIDFDNDRYSNRNEIYWKCLCKCGCQTSVKSDHLKLGKVTSCGCYKNELTKKRNTIDYTNMRIGHLTVLELTDEKDGKANVWKCMCDCGNITYVRSTHLGSNSITSCGCVKESRAVSRIKQILDENNIKYETDVYTKIDEKQFVYMDFVIENYYVIEYDGEQHTKIAWGGQERLNKQIELDKIKNNYCLINNIPIIRIPYTHQNNICLEDLLIDSSQYLI